MSLVNPRQSAGAGILGHGLVKVSTALMMTPDTPDRQAMASRSPSISTESQGARPVAEAAARHHDPAHPEQQRAVHELLPCSKTSRRSRRARCCSSPVIRPTPASSTNRPIGSPPNPATGHRSWRRPRRSLRPNRRHPLRHVGHLLPDQPGRWPMTADSPRRDATSTAARIPWPPTSPSPSRTCRLGAVPRTLRDGHLESLRPATD